MKHLLIIVPIVLLAACANAGVPMPSLPPTGTATPSRAPSEAPTTTPTATVSPLPTPIHEFELPNTTNSGFGRAAANDIGGGRVAVAFTGVPSNMVVVSIVNLATRTVEHSTTWENDLFTVSSIGVCFSEGTNEIVLVYRTTGGSNNVVKFDMLLNVVNSAQWNDEDLYDESGSGVSSIHCAATSDGKVFFETIRDYDDTATDLDIFGFVLSSDLSTNVTAFQKITSLEGGDERLDMLPDFQVDGQNPEWLPLLYRSQVAGQHIDFLHPAAGFPELKPRVKILLNSGTSIALRLNATADGNFRIFSSQGSLRTRDHYADGTYSTEKTVSGTLFLGLTRMEMTRINDGNYILVCEKNYSPNEGIFIQVVASDLSTTLVADYFPPSATALPPSFQLMHVSATPSGGYTVIYIDRTNDRIHFSEFE